MYLESSIQPVSPAFLRNESTPLNQRRETFRDFFQRSLNSKSSSRPPKVELTGVLVPCCKVNHGQVYKFKLETDSEDYLLSLDEQLIAVAKRAEWEEVTVKGYLDFENNIFEVEKISLAQA